MNNITIPILMKITIFEILNGGFKMPKYIVIHPLKKNVIEAMVNLPPEKN